MKARYTLFIVAAALSACGPTAPEPLEVQPAHTLQLNAEEVGILAFLNDFELTTYDVLDADCALRSDAAREIIDYRNGPDGVPGTPDDNPIDTLRELDAIYGVGRQTIEQLALCADSFGYQPVPAELDMLALLNDQAFTDLEVLDIDCGLHADAARNLIAHRDGPDGAPGTADDNLFHSLEEVDGVPQMGIWNVNQLMMCPDRLFSRDTL